MTARPFKFRDRITIGLVSAYLLAVGGFLILTRQIPAPDLLRILRARARRPYAGRIWSSRHEQGHCFVANVPVHLLSDSDYGSSLVLFEDGSELGPAHAAHDAIRTVGRGNFSHWGGHLYFSASDNTDPRTNGRLYTVTEKKPAGPKKDKPSKLG